MLAACLDVSPRACSPGSGVSRDGSPDSAPIPWTTRSSPTQKRLLVLVALLILPVAIGVGRLLPRVGLARSASCRSSTCRLGRFVGRLLADAPVRVSSHVQLARHPRDADGVRADAHRRVPALGRGRALGDPGAARRGRVPRGLHARSRWFVAFVVVFLVPGSSGEVLSPTPTCRRGSRPDARAQRRRRGRRGLHAPRARSRGNATPPRRRSASSSSAPSCSC